LTGDLGYLLQQEQVTIKFNVKVNDNAPTAGTTDITSTVTISSITKDPNTANNTNSEATDVLNPPPVDGDESVTTLEDNPISGNVLDNATDPNNDPVSVTQFVVGGTTYSAGQTATLLGVGTLVINANGSYTFTPAANYNGAVPVATYTVSDGKGGTDTSTLTISITPVNDAPIAVNDSYTTQEDTPLTIAVPGVLGNDTDVDGDTLTVTEFTQPTNGTLTQNEDGSFSYSPNANYNGSDSFTYTISDGKGGTSTATVNIGVTSVNDAPVAVNDSYTTQEDTPLTIAVPGVLGNDTDVDGDTLTVTEFTQPTNGTLTQNEDGSFSYSPNANYNGSDSFTYTISDGKGGTSTAPSTLASPQSTMLRCDERQFHHQRRHPADHYLSRAVEQ
jgi:VCBS repeat-containing protein